MKYSEKEEMNSPGPASLAELVSLRLSGGLGQNHNNNKGGKGDTGVDL